MQPERIVVSSNASRMTPHMGNNNLPRHSLGWQCKTVVKSKDLLSFLLHAKLIVLLRLGQQFRIQQKSNADGD